MYVLKGFMQVQTLIKNEPGQVSTIGELSNKSATFSKEIGTYRVDTYPKVSLLSFHSERDGSEVMVPESMRNEILRIGTWLEAEAIAGTLNGNEAAFRVDFLAEFSDTVADLETGEMVGTTNGLAYLPEYMLFSLKNEVESTYIKVWFADDSFQRQFDEYEITVVPPLDNLDDLFKTPSEVKALLDAMDDTEKTLRIEAAKGEYPSTLMRTEIYPWTSPLDLTTVLDTPWTVIIYGNAGNNIDLIRAAMIDYVLANSTHTRDEWSDYIPDLFKRTEHIIMPLWDNYSIPNETLRQGLFSPTVRLKDLYAVAEKLAPEYPVAHIQETLNVSVANYRSIAFLVVGGPENRDEIYEYQNRFPDYVAIPTTSTEFGRMSPKTQDWVRLLVEMLKLSEDLTEFSDVPLHMTKLMRDGVLYLVTTFDDVQYLMVAQSSYESIVTNAVEGFDV